MIFFFLVKIFSRTKKFMDRILLRLMSESSLCT